MEQPAGMVTVCDADFVFVLPVPPSRATLTPPCAGCAVNLPITPVVAVHDVVPDSKPGFRIFWPGEGHAGTAATARE